MASKKPRKKAVKAISTVAPKPMRVLIWDIETAQNLVALFQLFNNDYVDPSAIVRERYIICGCWKWLDEKKVYSVSVLDDPKRYEKDPYDDRHVVDVLHKVLSEADLIVHHRGDSFDKKWLDTRALFHNLPALPPIASVDTWKVAKSRLFLNSNKLDYLGKFLGVGKKIKTSPGLWMRVLKGEKKAIREMVTYNKGDVELQEKVFLKLRPFVNNLMSRELFGGTGCPRCGSKKIQSRGYRRAITRIYRRFQCQSCLGWFRAHAAESNTTTAHRII